MRHKTNFREASVRIETKLLTGTGVIGKHVIVIFVLTCN